MPIVQGVKSIPLRLLIGSNRFDGNCTRYETDSIAVAQKFEPVRFLIVRARNRFDSDCPSLRIDSILIVQGVKSIRFR